MKSLTTYLASGALALAFSAGVASAATITFVNNAPASWNSVDPTQSLAISGVWATSPSIVSGSVGGAYKSPFDPVGSGANASDALANWQAIQYYTVGSPFLQGSPAVMTFGGVVQSYLSVLWGSIDTYNAIQFVRNNLVVDTISGQQVLSAGGTPSASGAAFVKISESFDEIRIFSNFQNAGLDRPAFEFSNMVAAVPLPAGVFLLLGALGGMAALRRRKTV